ncbi:MAG TPA: hypothetical protein VI007_00345 [bacterium]
MLRSLAVNRAEALERGMLQVKGKGEMRTYITTGSTTGAGRVVE